MGWLGNLFRKVKKGVSAPFTGRGIFTRKGLIGTGDIFRKKGYNEARRWGKQAWRDTQHTLDQATALASKLQNIPGVGIIARPAVSALGGMADTMRYAGKQLSHGEDLIKNVMGGKVSPAEARRRVEKQIHEIRGQLRR